MIQTLEVNLGAANAGQVGNIYYTAIAADGTTLIARSNAGVSELGPGFYKAAVEWDDSWTGRLVWDKSGTPLAFSTFVGVQTSNNGYLRTIGAALGASKANQIANLYYTVISDSEAVLIPRTLAGATQLLPGSYFTNVAGWGVDWSGYVVWDISGTFAASAPFSATVVELPTPALPDTVSDYLYLPHAATWKKMSPTRQDAHGIDGSTWQEEQDVAGFFDPMTSTIADTKYGLQGIAEAHLSMFDPAQVTDLVDGDLIFWEGKNRTVSNVRYFRFDPPTLEAVVTVKARGK